MVNINKMAESFLDIYLVSPRTTFFYLLFVFAFLTFVIGLFVQKWRSTITIAYASFILGLYVFELFLAFSQPKESKARLMSDMANAAAAARGAPTDHRLILDVVSDLRVAGHDAYPTTTPTAFLLSGTSPTPMPLTSVALTKSVYCNESGTWLVFDSDRYGFNNPDRLWDQPADTVLIGDSFAQGACVPTDNSVAGALRANGISALSLGVAGTGPLIQLGVLKEYAVLKRPAHVYWLFYEGNDIHTNLVLERRSKWLRQYLQPRFTADLAKRQAETDTFLRQQVNASLSKLDGGYHPVPLASILRRVATLLYTRDKLGLTSCPRRSQDFALLQDIFTEAKRTVESWGGRMTVIYLPSQHQCDLFRITNRRINWFYDAAMSAIERAGVPIVDLKLQYQDLGHPDAFYYYPGSHFAEAGYRFVANAILARNDK